MFEFRCLRVGVSGAAGAAARMRGAGSGAAETGSAAGGAGRRRPRRGGGPPAVAAAPALRSGGAPALRSSGAPALRSGGAPPPPTPCELQCCFPPPSGHYLGSGVGFPRQTRHTMLRLLFPCLDAVTRTCECNAAGTWNLRDATSPVSRSTPFSVLRPCHPFMRLHLVGSRQSKDGGGSGPMRAEIG